MHPSDNLESLFSQVPEAFRELDALIDKEYPELRDFPGRVKDSIKARLSDPDFDDPEVAELLASRLEPNDAEIRALVTAARQRFRELLTKEVPIPQGEATQGKHFLTDEQIQEWLRADAEKAEQRKAQLKALDERQFSEEEQKANLAIANALRENVEWEREKTGKRSKARPRKNSGTDNDKKAQEELAEKLEAQAYDVAQSIDAFYDQVKKEYVVKIKESNNYQSHNEAQFKRDLRFHRLSAKVITSRPWSQVDIVLQELQEKKFVTYAGGLAGKACGFYSENGTRFLVTNEPRIIIPVKGKWPTLETFIVHLLCGDTEPYGEDQLTVFYGWLKVAYCALRDHRLQPGQALAIAGPVESGKSLLQHIITQILGGRCAKAALFLQGRTDFNAELFEAEHLMLEDEAASTSHAARLSLGSNIKEITANRVHACHPKNRQIVNLSPYWRITLTLNDRQERLLILPPLVEDLADKIILLRATCHPMPMPTGTAEEESRFWNTLVSELPAFIYYLVNDYSITRDWYSARFGICAFHHPILLTDLEQISPAVTLLGLIDLAEIWEVQSDVWEGTALQLRALLSAHHKTSRDAATLLHWINACGQYLHDLAKIRPARVKRFCTDAGYVYEIYRETKI